MKTKQTCIYTIRTYISILLILTLVSGCGKVNVLRNAQLVHKHDDSPLAKRRKLERLKLLIDSLNESTKPSRSYEFAKTNELDETDEIDEPVEPKSYPIGYKAGVVVVALGALYMGCKQCR